MKFFVKIRPGQGLVKISGSTLGLDPFHSVGKISVGNRFSILI